GAANTAAQQVGNSPRVPRAGGDRTGPPAASDRLARRYLDLWQSQLSGLASDQALTEQIARLFAAANTQMASVLQMAQGAPQHAPLPSSSEIGTPAAAVAPGHGADDVGELRKRVEALEARVAELESKLRAP